MIGAFVTILSLNLTLSLVQDYGVVYKTLPITDASVTTPIVVTSAAHGVPLGRLIHGVVTDVTGMDEANGLWVLTPLDADTFSLTTFTAQGIPVDSVGVNAYTGGGQVQWAFPDGQILLGRRNKMLATMVATPRILFVPCPGRAWTFEAYGGASPNITGLPFAPTDRGSAEQQAMALEPELATELLTFEVYVNGAAPDYGASTVSPDFGDFDATQAIVHALFAELFDAVGGLPRAKILAEKWPSQEERQGAMTQRGQQWMGILEVQMPVRKVPKQFVPIGTSAEIIVQPINPLVPDDQTEIDIS
jgi:hypothetical protein